MPNILRVQGRPIEITYPLLIMNTEAENGSGILFVQFYIYTSMMFLGFRSLKIIRSASFM